MAPRVPLALVALAATVAAGCSSSSTETVTTTVPMATLPNATSDLGPPRQRVEFGHIKSLAKKGGRYELRWDPAQFLSGETANLAAAQDGAVEPGEPVPNDNYVVDESRRLYTYFVRPTAKVTVLTNNGSGILDTPVTVAQLASLVQGKKVPGVKLYESLDSGIWITTDIDTVTGIQQQYRP